MLCFKRYFNEPLPKQDIFCRQPGTMCGYIEKGISMSKWEKRLAIITPQGDLIIYKEPLMGKIYELDKLKNMQIERFETGEITVRIQTKEGKKVRLRLTGNEAAAWAAKLINIRGPTSGHHSHPHANFMDGMNSTPRNSVLPSNPDISMTVSKTSRSASNHSKFSYSVTLHDGTGSTDDGVVATEESGEDALLSGDVPSIIDSARFDDPERARGGKVHGDVSEVIHSIMTTSSNTSSNRKMIRKQVDELIKKHIKEEEARKETELSPLAKKDAAFARPMNVGAMNHMETNT
ncbi:hypothetical protein RB195_009764 [Necator americanus]|uniref:PH-15 domain-containing protein n=1 Tax=Necator americanus TaxID=51031 RepID=A0ABR1CW31_NECAM